MAICGHAAATLCRLIASAKQNGLDLITYLRDLLANSSAARTSKTLLVRKTDPISSTSTRIPVIQRDS